jgi:hypothetical protein
MNISGTGSLSLQILRQSRSAVFEQNKAKPIDLSAIASGASAKAGGADPVSTSSDSMLELTRLKVALYERTGRALGVKMEDYASPSEYAAALSSAVYKIKTETPAHWPEIKAGIEHDLGLDKLGVSLEAVIDSIGGGESANTLDEALKKQISGGGSKASQQSAGLYSPMSALRQSHHSV